MKQELEFKNFEPAGEVRKLIESRIAHLGRQGASAPAGFPLSALNGPEKTLVANVQMHDVDAAIWSAFQKIEQQLEAYKSGRRGEQWGERIDWRREISRLKVGAALEGSGERPQ